MTTDTLPRPRATRKGIAYFRTAREALTVRDAVAPHHPDARIVYYTEGFTVQYRVSGPYYPELEAQS